MTSLALAAGLLAYTGGEAGGRVLRTGLSSFGSDPFGFRRLRRFDPSRGGAF